MTNVTKEEYWTTILNDPTQIGQITTEDTEFNRRINDVNLVLSNTFINSSDENLISNWETSLYIDEIEGKTITERKADILYMLCEKNYVPVSIIKRFLLNLIGDESKFVVEFIKDENKLIVHTDRADDTQFEAVTELLESVMPQNVEVVRYNHNTEISWQDIDRYADCTNISELQARAKEYGFTKFGQDLPPSGELCYNLKNVSNLGSDGVEWPYLGSKNLKKVSSDMPLLTAPTFAFRSSGITEYTGNLDGCTQLYFSFAGCTNLSKWRTRLPKLNTLAGVAFFDCILDKQSVLIICESIPSYTSGTHELGIGIHIDHQTDEEVLAAIANAEAKGWTMTVQWNGTPTSTASTMAMGSLIYAKVSEH